jgi:hypothetical protein
MQEVVVLIPKMSLTGRQPPAAVQPPSTAAILATRHSPLTPVAKRHVGPGQTWFNLTRQDVEKMSREQLQEKALSKHEQLAATEGRSLWQRFASLFRGSDKGS